MNALFALALLVSPSRAGVVTAVEAVVAPAGPSVGGIPVLSPVSGSLGAPALGAVNDLRGTLPLLPSPVPGLFGPVHSFVGEKTQAAAIRPETSAIPTSPVPEPLARGRATDAVPALPAKPSHGAPGMALSRDRKSAASLPEGRVSGPGSRGLAASPALERARPEAAAGLGRNFFDQSDESGRGALEDPSISDRPSSLGSATDLIAARPGVGVRTGGLLTVPDAWSAMGSGHGSARIERISAGEGDVLRDAVASVPGGVAGGNALAGNAAFFRSASPNGALTRAGAAAPPSPAAMPVLGAPRPIAIESSPSGLILRVRSILSGTASPAAAAPRLVPVVLPNPSTALLERGGLLEAFSVADQHAARGLTPLRGGHAPEAAARIVRVPSPRPVTAPLWWAWFTLPLFFAAIRGLQR